MKEIIAETDEDFLILQLYPSNLVHNLIPPLIQTLIANLDVAVENPEKAEASFLQLLDLQVHDLPVAHCVIIEGPVIIGEHETCILPLRSFYSPWRVYHYEVETPEVLRQELEIEVTYIHVEVSIRF